MLPRRGVCGGTTSACAENTGERDGFPAERGNYLRVRGEYTMADRMDQYLTELPPRARRIRLPTEPHEPLLGTTSACAENTCWTIMAGLLSGNYLRVRGEYIPMVTILMRFLELPPRARRIPDADLKHLGMLGTTSACAENTMATAYNRSAWRNYLRVRGEYLASF